VDPSQMVAMMPFAEANGIEVSAAAPDEVVGTMPWAPERCTVGGLMHGGALMLLADSIGAICAFLNLPEGASTSTIQSATNLFRGVREGTVHATSRPLHVGRTTIAVQTELRDDQGRLVALTTQSQAVLTPAD
jgi:1,4-dihydroxy-2-naphthoyl-CoA hydrolase